MCLYAFVLLRSVLCIQARFFFFFFFFFFFARVLLCPRHADSARQRTARQRRFREKVESYATPDDFAWRYVTRAVEIPS